MNSLVETELEELLKMVREQNSIAFSELVRRYEPMLKKVVSGFDSSAVSAEEAMAEACVALHKAALAYNAEQKKVTFGLFARICVYRRVCDLYSRAAESDIAEDLDVELLVAPGGVESLIISRERFSRIIELAGEILSPYEFRVFLLFLQGYGNEEMCVELSKSKKSVENAKARMIRHLREAGDLFADI